MRCAVGIDDTDSARGFCSTYLAYRIAVDLYPEVKVIPYPRLVRLNPNVPFKTRGNAAVCLHFETADPDKAFELLTEKVKQLSDIDGGANSGMVFLEDPNVGHDLEPLYLDALSGMVSPHRVRRILAERQIKSFELGNGMGIVGAASAMAFDERLDHTYELISYRREEYRGTNRRVDSSSVVEMERNTFPHTFNSYDHKKRKVLIAPHGPDPVFAGVRGDSPKAVIAAFSMLDYDEPMEGFMVFLSNQHTDAHLQRRLESKAFSSGWLEGSVLDVRIGEGAHTYLSLDSTGVKHLVAAYEPTGDLFRTARLLHRGDHVRVFGAMRKETSRHPMVINLERLDVIALGDKVGRAIRPGSYIPSPRANRHLTKPLTRYGKECYEIHSEAPGWLSPMPTVQKVLPRSP